MNQSTTPSAPDEIVARQARLAGSLIYLASFRPMPPRVIPEPTLPITDEQVRVWVAAHPFVRSTLAPHVARALAYIETFKPKGVPA